jgi:hypothetical protein
MSRITILLALLASQGRSLYIIEPKVEEEYTVWDMHGEGLMYGYRIPVITHAPDGSLVAVSEGRKDSTNDFGTKLLSIRRSSDGGLTWSTTGTFEDDGDNYSSSLGVILTDYVENITMVIYTLNHYDRSSCSIIMIKSYDNGLTWEDPENITKQIGQLPFYGGPGYGIQVGYDVNKPCKHVFQLFIDICLLFRRNMIQ